MRTLLFYLVLAIGLTSCYKSWPKKDAFEITEELGNTQWRISQYRVTTPGGHQWVCEGYGTYLLKFRSDFVLGIHTGVVEREGTWAIYTGSTYELMQIRYEYPVKTDYPLSGVWIIKEYTDTTIRLEQRLNGNFLAIDLQKW